MGVQLHHDLGIFQCVAVITACHFLGCTQKEVSGQKALATFAASIQSIDVDGWQGIEIRLVNQFDLLRTIGLLLDKKIVAGRFEALGPGQKFQIRGKGGDPGTFKVLCLVRREENTFRRIQSKLDCYIIPFV